MRTNVLWTLLAAILEDELIEEPATSPRNRHRKHRETQKEQLIVNILGQDEMENQIWMSLLMLAIVLSPVIWGQQYPWHCGKCHNMYCFEECNKAYLMMNWGDRM